MTKRRTIQELYYDHETPIDMLIRTIRESHSDMQFMFTHGCCFEFYKILKSQWPQAEPYFSNREGHVYTKIDKEYYDIRGKAMYIPGDLKLMSKRKQNEAEHWARTDTRRLSMI